EQLAGDELAPDDFEMRIATGFLRAGPQHVVGGNTDEAVNRQEWLTEAVTGVGAALLGLTVHCARCHDHKFDPIPQADYYRLQAVFAGVDRGDRPSTSRELVYAVQPHAPRPIHVLNRGDVEQPGTLAAPGALSCVPGLDPDF